MMKTTGKGTTVDGSSPNNFLDMKIVMGLQSKGFALLQTSYLRNVGVCQRIHVGAVKKVIHELSTYLTQPSFFQAWELSELCF